MKRILIANRAEIARRVIRTAHTMGIETVAVYSEPDAGALHVREATCAYALGGVTSADSYLRIDRLLQAARASGADAVHPGYGFLSEDAGFAQAVLDAGLVWIGPPPAAIRALGSKSAAKALAAVQGVPCLPGYAGADQSNERFAAEAGRVGYPLLVKAAAGGGGRGMRLVHEPAQLPAALASARSEALASFGNGELLIEQALPHPRHVEVQVFADAHGNCIHLGERDCSVQRRHQKIIEEAPSPAVDATMRERMGACAVALARAAGYVGAGTVEFLLDNAGGSAVGEATSVEPAFPRQQGPRNRLCGVAGAATPPGGSAVCEATGVEAAFPRQQGPRNRLRRAAGAAAPPGGSAVHEVTSVGAFYLMEMNTRLQVEHTVTEALTGLDLVEWQIRVACGEALPLAQHEVQFSGHAIEVRLCAEDENFNPHTGRVLHFSAPAATQFVSTPTGLRFDHAIEPGLQITPHYDAMLGKLIAHAGTREAAIGKLVQALGQTELLGLPSNRAFLAACLDHPRFRAGQALVSFLASEAATVREVLLKKEQEIAVVYGLTAILTPKTAFHSLPCPFATRPGPGR